MKKLVIILIFTCFIVFQTGCSTTEESENNSSVAASGFTNIAANTDDNTAANTSTNTAANTSTNTAANTSASTKSVQWPTEKWSTATPESQGLNEQQLVKTDKTIIENYPNVYSLLIIKNGYMVYEKYYNGAKETSYNPVFSVTKSVLSALTGIAVREKLIQSTQQKVSELIPKYFNKIDSPKKKDITIENVLTMTGGLESIDKNYYGFFASRDWLQYSLERPLTDEIGSKFVYNTGLTQMLSAVISEKSGMNTEAFAEKYLFEPLNIKVKRWDTDPAGSYGGGTGLYLTARDMAKFGMLYLNNGRWENKQIIPEDWVKASSTKQVGLDNNQDYGYLFWIKNMTSKTTDKSYYTYRADGAGGQKIVIIPELDMVVVVTADEHRSSLQGASDTQTLIEEYVIPAVK